MTASLCVYFSGFSATGDRQFGKSSLICFAKPKGILGSTTCCLSSGYNYYNMSCANAASMAISDTTFIAAGVVFNTYFTTLAFVV